MMKINRQKNERTEIEAKCDVKILKGSGLSDKYQPTSKLQSHDRSFADRRLRLKNLAWSYHILTILTSTGQGITILNIFDEHTQECLSSVAANHITIENLLDELFNVFLKRGVPRHLLAFDGNDLIPSAICEWLEKLELSSPRVELRKYGEDGYGLLFRDKFIRDLLHEKSFISLAEAQLWLTNWRSEHNNSIIVPLYRDRETL
jgi:putative transposase